MATDYRLFKDKYIAIQLAKHSDNSHWNNPERVYELLGGYDSVYELYCMAHWVSDAAQERILGFTLKSLKDR